MIFLPGLWFAVGGFKITDVTISLVSVSSCWLELAKDKDNALASWISDWALLEKIVYAILMPDFNATLRQIRNCNEIFVKRNKLIPI